ncbi:MAG: hypothetical protein ACYTHM_16280 [Planctomycetota bacterium]|jgi:hypothetical protein
MKFQDEELKRKMKTLKENFRFWSKINMALCGGCILFTLLLANALLVTESRLVIILLCTLSCFLPISLVVLLPSGRAAGYIIGHQHLNAYFEMRKNGVLSEADYKRLVSLEHHILEPVKPGEPRSHPPEGGEPSKAEGEKEG